MTKTLYIARHGKSSWDLEGISDIDRPLCSRGINNAYTMAGRLKEQGIIPDLMISSSACRAIHTATIFARVLEFPFSQLRINEKVYHGCGDDLVEVLQQVEDQYSSVMIFGHNPAFTDLANHFLIHHIDNIPTSGIVVLKFSTAHWKDLGQARPEYERFDYPKKE